MTHQTPRRERRSARLNLTVSAIALVSGMVGAAAVATPAAAQCVEGPPNIHTCSGQTNTPIVIVGGTSPGVYTNPGFGVDTSGNGNGLALSVSGTGLVSYTDVEDAVLAGGGVQLESTGADGFSDGDIYTFSTGSIIANGLAGLRLINSGGADTVAVWSGGISNQGGAGVDVVTGTGSGLLTLIFDGPVSGLTDGILADFRGTGFVDITAGQVTGQGGRGIQVETGFGDGSGVRVRAAEVFGATTGIAIHHRGSGIVDLNVTGAAIGGSGAGIYVEADEDTTDVSVRVGSVSGSGLGMQVYHDGQGSTFISAGSASGGDQGIWAESGETTTDMTVEVGDATGSLSGLMITSLGTGFTSVTSTGALFGWGWDGVSIDAGANSTGVQLDIVDAYGDQRGVEVLNDGVGTTLVRATGDVEAKFMDGIRVEAGLTADDVRIEAVDVSGGDRGIFVSNLGGGSTTVFAAGQVTATSGVGFGAGIGVDAGLNSTGVFIDSVAVTGAWHGIEVNNVGTGNTLIRNFGLVSSGGSGIVASQGLAAGGVSIQAVDVTSARDGVLIENLGQGGSNVVALGRIDAGDNGIEISSSLISGQIFVDANIISAGLSGIDIFNEGAGSSTVIVRGLVEGDVSGVSVESFGTQDLYLYNDGLIRNRSGLSSDLAIIASGGTVEITNNNWLVGTLDITAAESVVTNLGVWDSTGGTSYFNGDDDVFANADDGIILARSGAAVVDTTTLFGLNAFENSGIVTLRDGGTGDSLNVLGYAWFYEGSTLAVDIGGQNGSDVFFVGRQLEIQEGSRLVVNIVEPLVLYGRYTVALTGEGLTGEFEFDDVMLTAFAGLRDGYSDIDAYVEFVQLKALADAGITPNQKETAEGADSLPDGNPVKDALLLLPEEAMAVDAFDQLSGEVHPTARSAMIEDSRLIRDAALTRLADGEAAGAVWGRLIRDQGNSFGDDNAARADRDVRGVLGGVDYPLGGGVAAGLALGWVETDVDIDRRDSLATVESLQALAYVGGRFGAWGVRAGIGYAATSVETERTVAFPGFSAALEGDYDGSVAQGFVEVGYRLGARGGHVEPFANLTALRAETDAFTETGGPAALSGEAIRQDVALSTLGLRFETNRMGNFSIRGLAGWRHAWGDLEPVGLHAFDGGDTFTVLGAAQSEDAAVASVEAQWRLGEKVTLAIGYDGVLGDDSRDHAITGGLKVVF
jgi:outer membrane autotransporter protein